MQGEKAIGVTTILSLFILVLAYYWSSKSIFRPEYELEQRLKHILDAMLEIEKVHSVGKVRIAVGYGACQDLFVKASDIITEETPPSKAHHYGHIQTMQQLKETFALFFSAGSAAERYVSNDTLFRELVRRAEGVPSSYYAIGGNAPVMAKRLALEGASVMLAARREKYLTEEEQSSGIFIAGGPSSGSDTDDIHLIMEYYKGDTWAHYSAPRANRFIVHKDRSNPTLSSAYEFGKHLVDFRPHILVIGGLQMMDNFPFKTGEREKHLGEVHKQITDQPKSTLIHFEMASFTDENLLKDLKNFILPLSDSIGMNEQELPNLHSLLKYNNISVVSHQNPRVAEILEQMRDIFLLMGRKNSSDDRPLTRLHVHTLAFQAIMVDIRGPWKNTRAAVTKAALVAHRHVCHKEVEINNSNLLMDEGFSLSTHPNTGRVIFDDLNPVSCWLEEIHYQICIAPVLVCTKIYQTVGGGDNISAAGLILQV